jgi:hypothetical protein
MRERRVIQQEAPHYYAHPSGWMDQTSGRSSSSSFLNLQKECDESSPGQCVVDPSLI